MQHKYLKLFLIAMFCLWLSGLQAQTIRDIDGNVYKTVTIGKQVWMAENLKTSKYNDGRAIPLVTDNTAWEALNTPAYCWYDNDESANKTKCGALYNWFAVNTNKLCPTGWHVPNDREWTNLPPLSGGYRYADGTFYYIKDYSYWWTTTESSITSAYYNQVFWDGSDVKRDQSVKKDGFSVRCLKNK
jgi:hypothetical protein